MTSKRKQAVGWYVEHEPAMYSLAKAAVLADREGLKRAARWKAAAKRWRKDYLELIATWPGHTD